MRADYFADLVASVPGVPGVSPVNRGHEKPHESADVPSVPGVPGRKNEGASIDEAERLDADAREHLNERAAIAEYDGELSRDEAEHEAARRVYEYELADRPGCWLVMLAAPGDDLPEVERTLRLRFGAARVLGVRPYTPGRAQP